jgi:hypothetical protein
MRLKLMAMLVPCLGQPAIASLDLPISVNLALVSATSTCSVPQPWYQFASTCKMPIVP